VKEDGRGSTIKTPGVRISVVCNFFVQASRSSIMLRFFKIFIRAIGRPFVVVLTVTNALRDDKGKNNKVTYPQELHQDRKDIYIKRYHNRKDKNI
jgi:hypothetical protein